jgi:hypothetical protein
LHVNLCSDEISIGGVAYMYWRLATAEQGIIPVQKDDLMKRAKRYIEAAIRSGGGRRSSSVSTMLTGMAGVYAVAAAIHTSNNEVSHANEMVNQVLALAPTAVQNGVPSEVRLFCMASGIIIVHIPV